MADHRDNARRDRLKQALRENLKRRKAQAKGRVENSRTDGSAERDSGEQKEADSKRET